MAVAVRVDQVWKAYPRWTPGTRTLKGLSSRRLRGRAPKERRWALRDVSFQLQEGESAALIGANGAGKSTLLRLASGIGRPTRGSILVAGDTASVLSLGDAFDLELTWRENAITTAMLAGLRQAQARELLPAMLEFAELEAFAEAPVRTYSDGMKLRLAFGVVAQLQPSILLLDEVLAVGDLRFQDKCMAHIGELREHGTSVLLASHSLDEVQEQCDVAVWLQGGAVRAAGDVTSVVEEYRERMQSETRNRTPPVDGNGAGTLELRRNRFGSQELTIERVALRGPEGSPATEVASGSPLSVAVELDNHSAPVEDPIVGVSIHRAADGVVAYDCNTESAGVRLGRVAGTASITLLLEHLDLEPGEYMVDVGVYEPAWAYAYDFHWQAYPLRVLGLVSGSGLARPAQRWTVAE